MTASADRLVVVGLSHHTAPIEVRERYELSGDRLLAWVRDVLDSEEISECVLLSTCNRTECYAIGPDPESIAATLRSALALAAGVVNGGRYMFDREGADAVRHLFRVTSGLDSLVIGEPQIQGQVRRAYQATDGDGVGPALHRLFQSALAAGGRVRATTAISRGTTSIPAAAVGLARKVFGSLEGRSVLVVGTGEMGQITVRCLRSEGVGRVFVASRNLDRAERVGRILNGIPLTRDGIWGRLPAVDLMITATQADAAFVTAARFEAAHDEARPTVILDIAVPRNVEAAVGELTGVFLYNVDDLQRVVDQARETRAIENDGAQAVIDHHAGKFWSWFRGRAGTPAIQTLRGVAHGLLEAELGRVFPPGPRDADREEALRLASRSLLNKILHGPTRAVRLLTERPGAAHHLEELTELLSPPADEWGSSRIVDGGLG